MVEYGIPTTDQLGTFRVVHEGLTCIQDWMGGATAQAIDFARFIAFILNCDGVQIIKKKGTSHYLVFIEIGSVPRWVRSLLGSMMLVLAWNPATDGEFSANVAMEFLGACIEGGVEVECAGGGTVTMHLTLGSSVADSVANAPLNSQMGPTAYQSCLKCKEVGIYAAGSVRLVGTNAMLRTDQDWITNGVAATESRKAVGGVKPLVNGTFPMQHLRGWKVPLHTSVGMGCLALMRPIATEMSCVCE